MVGIPGRIPKPRPGLVPPLPARWNAALAELSKVAPGTPFGSPMSELELDNLENLIEQLRKTKAPPPENPMVTAANAELSELRRQYNAACVEIRNAQPYLRRAADDWKHALLADIPADCFTIAPPLPSVYDEPEYASVFEIKQAAKALQARVLWVRGLTAQISAVRFFDSQPREQQCLDLIKSVMVAQHQTFKDRLIAVEAENAALRARVDRLERRNKPKLQQKAAAPSRSSLHA